MSTNDDFKKAPPALPGQLLDIEFLVHGLYENGLITQVEANDLIQLFGFSARDEKGKYPILWLAERKLKDKQGKPLTTERLVQWLADYVDLPYYRIDPLKIDMDAVTGLVAKGYAQRFGIFPVEVDEHSATFAVSEPFVRDWENELGHVLRKPIKRVLANPNDIERYLEELFGVSLSIRKAKASTSEESVGVTNLEALIELGRSGQLEDNDRHVVSIVDWLLQYAFDQRASDIHLEPRRDEGNVRFRIDGVMHQVYKMPMSIVRAITSRIKAIGRLDIVEKRRPQDGRVRTRTPAGQEIELRLSTMPTAFGEKLVMRIFDPDVLVRSLSQLGLSRADSKNWKEMTSATHGIVLVTGPTGSGKTTTLYSSLKSLANERINVCTVEDPIEMVVPAFNQMQVNHDIGLDFASGVRTLMRQDPDIVMVGEIRDLETANVAVQAALTGHLVLATLHTNDAASAVTRLLDLGVPHYLITASVLGVVAQRLVRTLCPHCKHPTHVSRDEWKALTHPWSLPS
ncbi:MAG: GspE/PulE family protein, partial [gamma proteobacterium symbiont of Bathyaustriella thionipta]|nr:GspE/PulE family protein [gamma proteobacterium symbiont of Bathyaustriella thionipta]